MSHRRPQQGPLAPHPGSGLEQSTCLTAAQGVRLLRSSPQSVGWGEPDADERRAEFPEAALASAGQEEAEGERRVGPVWKRPCLCREWGPRSPSPTFPCSASLFSRSAHPVASFPCLGFFPLGNLLPPRALLRPPYLKRLQSGRPPKHSNKAARHARPPSRASGRPRHAGVAENSPRAPATDRQGERDDGDGRSSALWLSFPEENEANAASSSGGAKPAGSGSRQLSIPVRNVPAGSPRQSSSESAVRTGSRAQCFVRLSGPAHGCRGPHGGCPPPSSCPSPPHAAAGAHSSAQSDINIKYRTAVAYTAVLEAEKSQGRMPAFWAPGDSPAPSLRTAAPRRGLACPSSEHTWGGGTVTRVSSSGGAVANSIGAGLAPYDFA